MYFIKKKSITFWLKNLECIYQIETYVRWANNLICEEYVHILNNIYIYTLKYKMLITCKCRYKSVMYCINTFGCCQMI